MTRNHLKRLAAPRMWILQRREQKFVTRPVPGRHPMARTLPASIVFQSHIPIVHTRKELRKVLHTNVVQVDAKRLREVRAGIGYLDPIALPDQKEYYRLIMTPKGTLGVVPIPSGESAWKVIKIIGKTTLPERKTQINCSDGRNIMADGAYVVGDSLLVDLEKRKIMESFPLSPGTFVQLLGGKHIGKTGIVTELTARLVKIIHGDTQIITAKKYAFVLGREKPALVIAP